ncbi:PLP-dependent aminotransferase family protein [Salinadaptatus halalkaliphilus]|uniref:PLP-dependent aminotransferase family protein n=1 Tax=Salinadaptatus halalkaliphilus TaxID=2419781 RepID=A0A4S3TRQ0_9EURY|nr:PLP-dependent aminotransferase family protein [Salinadaptatus halalkaliphilus]THE65288.1 PLP-dependent aminotransferase family protein [Salinadaptatus halalkaliphilus]
MVNSTPPDGFDHLYSDVVRETMDGSVYGSWRSIRDADAVSLSFGFPYPGSFPNQELLSAAEELFEAEADCALQYSGGEYAAGLPKIIADQARDRGIDCATSEIHLTNGATNAIDTVCQTFLDSGDTVFVESPTFMGALRLFRNYDVDISGFDVDEDGIVVDAVADELAKRQAAGETLPTLLYTIPNFHNPTGVTSSADRRERLLELAETYDFMILEDDPYGQLRYEGTEPPPIKALDETGRTIHVNTFSKTIAPGVRTGWAIAEAPIIEQFDRINAGGEPSFTRGLITSYAANGRLDQAIDDLCAGYRERRDQMVESLETRMPPGTTWNEPAGGFFMWVELPEGIDAAELLPDAIDAGVTYLPGSFFYHEAGGERHVRLSFSHASPSAIDEGIKALTDAVRTEISAAEADD